MKHRLNPDGSESPVFGFCIVSIALFAMIKFDLLQIDIEGAQAFVFSRREIFLKAIIVLLSISINFIFLASVINRLTVTTKRGLKLKRIALGQSIIEQFLDLRFILFFVFFTVIYVTLGFFSIESNFQEIEALLPEVSGLLLYIHASFSLSFTALLLMPFQKKKERKFVFNRRLKKYPQDKNSVVLGSILENGMEKNWEVVGTRALNANILITGSIGTGKSQSGILPIVSQIAQNFSIRPSILFIDPKRSMPDEVEEILRENFEKNEGAFS